MRKQGHYLAVVKISLRKCNLVKENLELETKTQMPSLRGPELLIRHLTALNVSLHIKSGGREGRSPPHCKGEADLRADSGRARGSLGKMGWSKKETGGHFVTHPAGAHFQILPLGIQNG